MAAIIKAKHCIITDNCRELHGEIGAFNEAVKRLRDEYIEIVKGHKQGIGSQIHLTLSIERKHMLG
jgi:hypothetical protein